VNCTELINFHWFAGADRRKTERKEGREERNKRVDKDK
jgi:hypothetical protein